MSKAVKLTATEFAEKVKDMAENETFDFATVCNLKYDDDLNLVTEQDCEEWFGVKKLKLFDSELIIIGYYGGGFQRIIEFRRERSQRSDVSYKEEIEDFQREIKMMFRYLEIKEVFAFDHSLETKIQDLYSLLENNISTIIAAVKKGETE